MIRNDVLGVRQPLPTVVCENPLNYCTATVSREPQRNFNILFAEGVRTFKVGTTF